MCNAWNHTPDCVCGWGGSGHLGRRGFGASSNDRAGFWWIPSITQTRESYTVPNAACPVCGASVFFYQSPSGGRVFFDELGPPWPKHPCTNNTSAPKSLNVSSGVERISGPSWSTAGWSPFFISNVSNTYKSVLEVTGTIEEESMTLFVRKNSHIATSQITEQCIAFLRRGVASNFELSLIIGTHKSITTVTISAFSTISRIGETATVSRAKDVLPNKTPGLKGNDSNTESRCGTTANPRWRMGTTEQMHRRCVEFAKMTPEEKEQVKKDDPFFYKSATRAAPVILKVEAARKKRLSSRTEQIHKLFLEFAKMTPAEKEQVKKDDPDFHRVALTKSPLILKMEARRQASEIKKSHSTGKTRSIQVEVRRKRVVVTAKRFTENTKIGVAALRLEEPLTAMPTEEGQCTG